MKARLYTIILLNISDYLK